MPLPNDKAWFPAKSYGYGWGLPKRPQGWAVFIAYIVALIGGRFGLAPRNVGFFFAYLLVITGLLIAICVVKGEALGTRSSDKDENGNTPGQPR